MSRLILIIAIAAVVYLLIRSYRKQTSQLDETITKDMVSCAHCNVHLPKDESVQADGQFFCCAKHRDTYLKKS